MDKKNLVAILMLIILIAISIKNLYYQQSSVNYDSKLPTTMNWLFTPEDIRTLGDEIIASMEKLKQQILAVPDEECNFDNVMVPYGRIYDDTEFSLANIIFYQYVSPSKELRDVSEECYNKVNNYKVEFSMNKEIYGKISKVIENIENGKAKAPEDPEDKQLLEYTISDYRKNGLHLPDDKLNELNELQKKMNELINSFSRCYNEAVVYQNFTKEELSGMSEDFFKGLFSMNKDDEKVYEVEIDVPTYGTIMEKCSVSETRKKTSRVFNQRCKVNIETLNQIVAIRLKIANLLGFKTHADAVLQYTMAKNPENVMNFLNGLKEKLDPLAEKELEKLVKLKEEDLKELNEPFDGTFNEWDLSYYESKLKKKEYDIDSEEVKKYFPLDETLDEVFKFYEELFSLKFKEVKSDNIWHPDVRQISIYDKETDYFFGTFYLDLYPREGKFNYFSYYGLTPSYEKEDGTLVNSVGCILGNFPKPTDSEPSLLTHNDVLTLLHESGHAIHMTVSKQKWTRLSSSRVEHDFIETPSQMNENWVWEKEFLKRISHHYEDYNKSLPDDLIENIIKTKNFDSGLFNIRQIFFNFFDMKIHNTESVEGLDVNEVYNQLKKEILLYNIDEETWGIATFIHIVSGYDAGYYGYLYSNVFAADLYFSEFRKNGIVVQPEVGKRYRELVLEKGSSKPALNLLKDFLGREPNDEAFIKSLGLN